MKRTFASVATLVLVGVTTTASGASQTYKGEIAEDTQASVALEVEARNGRRVVTEFTVREFPLECDDDTVARLDRARLAGRARVTRKGRFELAASNATQRLAIHGRMRGGREVTGRVTYDGRTEFADQTLNCRADGLRWSATR